jgi:hypothetical protein
MAGGHREDQFVEKPRFIRSSWPKVIGSKVPGYTAILAAEIVKPPSC